MALARLLPSRFAYSNRCCTTFSSCSRRFLPFSRFSTHTAKRTEIPEISANGRLESPLVLETDVRKSIQNQTDFSLHLTNHVSRKKASSTNFVFSPLSIHVIFSLIASGSKSKTLDKVVTFLRSSSTENLSSLYSQIVARVLADGSSSGGPRLSFVNGVWVDHSLTLTPAFEEAVVGTYQTEAKSVDFQTKAAEVIKEVNLWVSKETNGLIENLLPSGSVDDETRLVFANALYFKGEWAEKFESSQTINYDFTLLDGNPVQVPFVTNGKKLFVSAFDGFKVLRLPYKQRADKRHFSMYILLPDAKDGLWSLFEKLSSESGFLDHRLPMQQVSVGVFRIPKFKISFGFKTSGMLEELGLYLPFGGEGDLTEMVVDCSISQELHVPEIFHKSFVDFNEEGTEAAAASISVIVGCGLGSRHSSPPMDFVADHPFIFLIREDTTGVVIFAGHVINPSLSA